MKLKCDKCGSTKNKISTRRNYPFGKKSKPRKINICNNCKLKKYVKEYEQKRKTKTRKKE